MVCEPPVEPDARADVIVIGSGSAGLPAALAAAVEGADVRLLEKAPLVGGTTAVSGGGLWIPYCRQVREARGGDPGPAIRSYLRRVAGDRVPDAMLDAFLDTCEEAVSFVEAETALEFVLSGHPDYHPEWDGAHPDGYMLEPALFDGSRLGDALSDVRESPHLPLPATKREMLEAGAEYGRFAHEGPTEEFRRRREADVLALGRALVAGLYEACLDRGVTVELEAPAVELLRADGEVCGVVVADADDGADGTAGSDGDAAGRRSIVADAVVLAAGGMEWDAEMCENFLRGPMTAPASPPYNEGDAIVMGVEVGAKLGNMDEAWWFPTARIPGETWPDGSPLYRLTLAERTFPGSIVVNEAGERFCNEAGNYHDLPKAFHAFDPGEYDYTNLPAYAVFDDSYRRRYSVLGVSPADDDPEWLPVADDLRTLAATIGVDPDGLVETVAAFNRYARIGEDPAFGRGRSAHDRQRGDETAAHPTLGPLDDPPYYAVELLPGSVGTKGGLVTDTDAAVLDVRGDRIPGLYAASNCTAHVMGIGYAGGGATLGPNLVFGYVAGARAAARASDD
jgi:succinate dehydrogenase/fumarate reductase flavoprotein subunit